jgi:serine/threonine protein kinase
MHDTGIIHLDIKPSNTILNLCFNRNFPFKEVFVVDFGLSERFIDKTGTHVPLIKLGRAKGTVKFSSLNS